MSEPIVVRTRKELAGAVAGRERRAVVMTMGALHAGHLSLVRRAAELAEQVVVTIFVNPLQFGAGEDLAAYPRDLQADLAALAGSGADIVFVPSVEEMYGGGRVSVSVDPGPLGDVWEGAARPGHFAGVLTVVHKLACLTRADVALFGQKDAQQLVLVRRMVRDLDLPLRIEGAPIVRSAEGLALSSRNAYLSPDEVRAALALSRGMAAGVAAAKEGASPRAVFEAAAGQILAAPGVQTDYLALVGADDLRPLGEGVVHIAPGASVAPDPGPAQRAEGLLIVAARVGPARLIDNAPVRWG